MHAENRKYFVLLGVYNQTYVPLNNAQVLLNNVGKLTTKQVLAAA